MHTTTQADCKNIYAQKKTPTPQPHPLRNVMQLYQQQEHNAQKPNDIYI
jgi:hypothetical protein